MANSDKKDSGISLSNYSNQLAVERRSRTLTLRRHCHPTIASALIHNTRQHTVLVNPAIYPLLQPETFSKKLGSNHESTIREYLNTLITIFNSNPSFFTSLLDSQELTNSIIEVLANNSSETVLIGVLNFLFLVFPNCGTSKQLLIDGDLILYLTNFLTTGSISLIKTTIQILPILIDNSSYARDSILCYDVFNILVDFAKTDEYGEASCLAIQHIFSGHSEIDSSNLSLCIQKISDLLDIQDVDKLQSILSALVGICERKPSLVLVLAENGKYPLIVSFLEIPVLISQVLPLISVMTFGHPSSVSLLIEIGLLNILFPFLGSEHTADVYWVLAHMVESSPSTLMSYFSDDFFQSTIEIAVSSSFDVKKSTVFFLATIIKYSSAEKISKIVTSDTLEILSEMLSCSEHNLIVRCLDAFIRICQILNSSSDINLISNINNSYLSEILETLTSHESCVVADQANALQSIIEGASVPVLL